MRFLKINLKGNDLLPLTFSNSPAGFPLLMTSGYQFPCAIVLATTVSAIAQFRKKPILMTVSHKNFRTLEQKLILFEFLCGSERLKRGLYLSARYHRLYLRVIMYFPSPRVSANKLTGISCALTVLQGVYFTFPPLGCRDNSQRQCA
jgi:hypothetical protein